MLPLVAAPPSTDPIGGMLQCHERIRRFSNGLQLILGLDDLRDPRAPDAARQCARYFREGLPLHGRDEDESLAPRLRARKPGVEVEEALDRIAGDHDAMDAVLARLLPLLDAFQTGEPPSREALAAEVDALAALVDPHLAIEEAVIYPACATALTTEDRLAIATEMRKRRTG